MSLTIDEAKKTIIILKGIQAKELKEATTDYLKPIEHKAWHDVVQEEMMEATLNFDKFLKGQANKLYKLLKEREQMFLPKKNEEHVAATHLLKAIELITKVDTPKKYKVWEYLDELYNRVVTDDVKDTIVEYFQSFNTDLEKVYSKVITNTYEKVSQTVSTEETPFEFNKSNKWVKQHVENKAIKWSKQVTESTEKRIKQQLVKGYEKGESTYDITKNIKGDTGFSFSRAEKIARTEVFSSGNYIDYLSFNQNEDVVGYKWCTMEDGDRVRTSHRLANGQFKKKGEPFTVGGSKLLHPGDNSLGAVAKEIVCCRCYLEPVFEDEAIEILEIPSGKEYTEGESELQSELDKTVQTYRAQIDDLDTPESRLVKFYMDSHIVTFTEDLSLEIPMSYDPRSQEIYVNLQDPSISNYDINEAISHELGHMIDDLAFAVAENEALKKAIIDAQKYLQDNLSEFDKVKGSLVMDNMCVSDIISALLGGDNDALELVFFHEKNYWNNQGMKEKEIFANLVAIHIKNDTSTIEFIKGNFVELYSVYKSIMKE